MMYFVRSWDRFQYYSTFVRFSISRASLFVLFFNNIFLNNMCYLKDVMLEENLDLHSFEFKDEQSYETVVTETLPIIPTLKNNIGKFSSPQSQMILKLLLSIERNNNFISKINSSICPNSQQVEKITINFEKKRTPEDKESEAESWTTNPMQNIRENDGQILNRLFGKRNYKYALKAAEKFEDTIYKERNFNLGIKLVDLNGNPVQNCNLLTLCFAICTTDGDWILENRVGDPMLKGKTQKELYRGEAQFEKLYVREVSRIYPNGKVNIVVYPKQSSIKYFTSALSQQCVESQLIKPLLIENISIRAKRKQC